LEAVVVACRRGRGGDSGRARATRRAPREASDAGVRAEVHGEPRTPSTRPSTAIASQLVVLRGQLSLAAALERAGRSGDALRLAEGALGSAQRMGYPPAILEAALAKGSVLASRTDVAAGVEPLTLAEELALQQRQLSTAVIAGARRIYLEGVRGTGLDRLAGQADVLERLRRGLGNEQYARPRLLNYLGILYMARDQRESAWRSFSDAKRALGHPVPVDPELMFIDMNVAMLTRDRAERELRAQVAWQRVRDQLGEQHPVTLYEQCRYAHYVMDPIVAAAAVAIGEAVAVGEAAAAAVAVGEAAAVAIGEAAAVAVGEAAAVAVGEAAAVAVGEAAAVAVGEAAAVVVAVAAPVAAGQRWRSATRQRSW